MGAQVAQPLPTPGVPAPKIPYRPANAHVGWVVGLLIAAAAIAFLSTILALNEIRLIGDIGAGRFVSESQAQRADVMFGITGVIQVMVFIGTVIAWCIWQHRAQSNLSPLYSHELKFSPGWAVGWWFIPFANLFKPYQAMKELWQASDPNAEPTGWKQSQVSSALGWWWVSYLAAGLLGNLFGRFPEETIEQIQTGFYLAISSDVALIVAAFLAIFLIREIHRRQELKASDTGGASTAPSKIDY